MYQIHLEALKLSVSVGCYTYEKHCKQSLLLDLKLNVDAKQVANSDSLEATIDYDGLSQALTEIAHSKHFDLIETLAHTLVEYINNEHPGALTYLKLSKPHALDSAKNVAIEYRFA